MSTPTPEKSIERCEMCGRKKCPKTSHLHGGNGMGLCHGHSNLENDMETCDKCGDTGRIERHLNSCERDGCDGACSVPCPSCSGHTTPPAKEGESSRIEKEGEK